jgi:hypothetical protein
MFNEQSSVENGSETRFFPLGSGCHGSQALWVCEGQRGQRKTGIVPNVTFVK